MFRPRTLPLAHLSGTGQEGAGERGPDFGYGRAAGLTKETTPLYFYDPKDWNTPLNPVTKSRASCTASLSPTGISDKHEDVL